MCFEKYDDVVGGYTNKNNRVSKRQKREKEWPEVDCNCGYNAFSGSHWEWDKIKTVTVAIFLTKVAIRSRFKLDCYSWVLHIAKVGSIPSPYLGNVDEQ